MTTVYTELIKLPLKVQKLFFKMATDLENGAGKLEKERQIKRFRSLCKQYNINIEWWAKQEA